MTKDHFPVGMHESHDLLGHRVCDLGLTVEGSRLGGLVERLHAELEAAGLDFRPRVYLTDEWGCPDGVPVVGVPFYLADERLARLQDAAAEGLEGETDEEIMRYLRHECGHAFNYAYRLHEEKEWRELFGPYSRPYLEDYHPDPFSKDYVRHLPGWYAQKHPDEDFAETFAVWLTPGGKWRQTYRGWGCWPKLQYMQDVARRLGRSRPLVETVELDAPVGEMTCTLADFLLSARPDQVPVEARHDHDLEDIFVFPASGESYSGEPAASFLERHRRSLAEKIYHWTGVDDDLARSLVNHLAERARVLGLIVDPARAEETLLEVSVYLAALSMSLSRPGGHAAS